MSEEIKKTVKKYYDYISVGNRTQQTAYFVEQHDKPIHLELYIKENTLGKTLLLTRSKKNADMLGNLLKDKEINATVVHGNHKPEYVEEVTAAFNKDEAAFLITTSKIYEAQELSGIKTIIYYDLPFEAESYFKTLREVDEVGKSVSFVSIDDEKMLETIEMMMKYDMPKEEIESFTHTVLPKIDKNRRKKPRHKKNRKKETEREDSPE